jgi:hypothetical protein
MKSAKKESDDATRMLVGGLIVGLGSMGGIAIMIDKPAWTVVAFMLAFPGIIAVAAVAKAGEMKRAASWPTASGRITRSELADGEYQERQVRIPRVEYQYKVGSAKKVGKRVNLAEVVTGVAAKEAVARYPVGAAVEVYYNPADPSEAVLEVEAPPEIMRFAWGLVAFLTAAIALGAWFFLVR